MDLTSMPPVFDPVFREVYETSGLEAALRDLIEHYDVPDDEAEAVSETLRRVIAVPANRTSAG